MLIKNITLYFIVNIKKRTNYALKVINHKTIEPLSLHTQ